MLETRPFVIPPAPTVHPKDLPAIKLLLGSIRDSLSIWPDYAFDVDFNRGKLFGIESVLVNDPAGVRHVVATNAANYVRPVILPAYCAPWRGMAYFLLRVANGAGSAACCHLPSHRTISIFSCLTSSRPPLI